MSTNRAVILFLLCVGILAAMSFAIKSSSSSSSNDPDELPEEFEHSNATNCTNGECLSDADYYDLMMQYIYPNFSDWVMIGLHAVVFVVGVVGNSLVCIAIYRNRSMRTVTNYFIVNLAVADLLVIIICLPSTVLWDVTETWFLGLELCKTIPYLQTVSVSVSILTLTFISIDRWYAICFPLRFKSTTSRAKTAIAMIWIFSFLVDIPDTLVLHTVPHKSRVKTVLFTQCKSSLDADSETAFRTVMLLFLYVGPLIFMSIAYWQIVRVLWRSDIPGHNLSTRICQMSEIPACAAGNPEGQLRSRRKAAKMLVAVVLTFAICYFPVHLLLILRCIMLLPSNEWTIKASLIAHWLCYFNSAVNPLIYNFMSGKFRREFRRTFRDCTSMNQPNGRGTARQLSSYMYTANGYRSTLQNRREAFCLGAKQASWMKKTISTGSHVDDIGEANCTGNRATEEKVDCF